MSAKLMEQREQLHFATAQEFRRWLQDNCRSSEGIWLVLGKPGGPQTLSSDEALEEALCFGWIDGLIRRVDESTYVKYFSPRHADSQWSARNIALVQALEASGRMTDFGRDAIDKAKASGRFAARERPAFTEEQVESFLAQIRGTEPAYTNFLAMSPSVQRTYTAFYLDAKSPQSRQNRLDKIADRLNRNLKPM